MCSLDLEPCAVWKETPRMARKEHMCHGCGATITPRTSYLSVFCACDGNAGSERLCFACWWDWKRFGDDHGMRPMPSGFWDDLQECVQGLDDVREEAVLGWRPALARLKARWRTSPSGRKHVRSAWMKAALGRERALTRKVVRSRRAS